MSADHIVAWLQKKRLDPLIPLDQESYQRIQKLNKVSIVYHGDPTSLEADQVRKIALADEHNSIFLCKKAYYVTSIGKRQGMVEILSGSQVLRVNHKVDHSLSRWIRNHERPIVVPFDDRTISDMFKNNKPTLCLFNKGGNPQLLQEFTESAISYLQLGKQLVFTHLNETSDFRHFKEFAQYIKINPQKTPIVLIDIKTRSKYVIEQKAEEISHEDISYFLEQWKSGILKKYDVIGTNKQTRAEQL